MIKSRIVFTPFGQAVLQHEQLVWHTLKSEVSGSLVLQGILVTVGELPKRRWIMYK